MCDIAPVVCCVEMNSFDGSIGVGNGILNGIAQRGNAKDAASACYYLSVALFRASVKYDAIGVSF